MPRILLIVILAGAAVGCAHRAPSPVAPGLPSGGSAVTPKAGADDWADPHRLWGEWTFYFNGAHDKVEAVPRRHGSFHLNALKFLEDYHLKNYLKIVGVKNNGDGTIDLTVSITHPFYGHPEFTGFDVKGIIMFNGSYEYPNTEWSRNELPKPYFLVSWRLLGDPELLNADGYTPRWSPSWDSGSDKPIFNYWEGRFATGVPTADLNAFLNFYSHEERHMFGCYATVERTYTIWLPPGPVVAGYAVEACWEPPTVTPVTNPLEDFPLTANQPEAYCLEWVINEGEVITECETCCGWLEECTEYRVKVLQWGGWTSDRFEICFPWGVHCHGGIWYCQLPPMEDWYWVGCSLPGCAAGNGTTRLVGINWWYDGWYHDHAFVVADFTVNDPDL
jgi:hypothetical protein